MNKKFGLVFIYVLLIISALSASSRDQVDNPLTMIGVALSILILLLFFIIRQRQRNR